MTIRTSGQLLFTDIITEFGGTGPYRLSDYYRGGFNVPVGTAAGTGSYQTSPLTPAAPAQISTSGVIEFSQFYGTSASGGGGGTVTIDAASIGCSQGNYPFGTTNCFVRMNSDGTISHGGGGGATTNHYSGPASWATPSGGTTDYSGVYEFKITAVSHSFSGTSSPSSTGITGSSCNMVSSCPGGQANSTTWTVQVIRISDSAVMATFTVDNELDNT